MDTSYWIERVSPAEYDEPENTCTGDIVEKARQPFMHRTDSLDYPIVLTSEIWMIVGEEQDDLLLKARDVLIQRGKTTPGQAVVLNLASPLVAVFDLCISSEISYPANVQHQL